MPRAKIYVVVGPTASGKTAFSIKLAKKVNGEIINADSRQVYQGLNIGTGKVTKKEQGGVRHHLLDIVKPQKIFTVIDYKKLAEQKIKEIIARNKTPIIIGGTGFYIQAIIDNLNFPEVPPDKKLRTELAKQTTEQLFTNLKKLDPERAKNIDPKNHRRLIRAIEIAKKLGKVPNLEKKASNYNFQIIGLKIKQKELAEKIHQRLITRLKHGMIAEAQKLHLQGLSWKRMEELGLEYRYLARFLQNKMTKTEMIEQLEKEIIKYAKRQMTWFKRDKRIKWIKI